MSHLRISKIILALSDLLAFLISFGLGGLLLIEYAQYEDLESLSTWWIGTGTIHSAVHFFFVFLCLFRFYVQGIYSKRLPFWDELRFILMTLLYLALLNGMVVLVAKWPFSRVLWLSSWVIAMMMLPLFRSMARKLMRKTGIWQRPTLVIGSGQNAYDTLAALQSEPQLGFSVVEFLSINGKKSPQLPPGAIVREIKKEDLIAYLRKRPNHEIFVALDEAELSEAGTLIEEMGLYFPEVFFVPSLAGLPLFGMDAYHFFSHELLILRSKNNLGFRPQFYLKRVFDLVVTSVALVLLSPFMLWIALRIRMSGPGVVFAHKRIGRNGESFMCYKFRSMVPNAEAVLKDILAKDPVARQQWEDKMKIDNDPRVTSIGQFLRKTSMDELPQLWNILKGDMSLVGPRPIIQKEIERYGHRIEFYQRVRPGLTGLWQVSGRSDTDYNTRVRLDTWYSKNWTLWYDLAILFKTVKIVLNRKGAY